MNPTIRRATRNDSPIIAQFNALMAEETEHRTLDQGILRKGVEEVLEDSSKGVYYVAELDGTVIGQLLITYEWSDWRDGMFWWIQSVYVKEEHRGRGVFTALYRSIESMARNTPGVCGLRLYVERENEQAQAAYERLGMRRTPYELFEIDFILKKETNRR